MKILICSDLHTNFHRDFGQSAINGLSNADAVVIAGDLSTGKFLIEKNIELLCDKYNSVIFVSGNHEYYHSDFNEIDDLFQSLCAKHSNFYWLENSRVDIDGVNFIGCTLWFGENDDTKAFKSYLNDFRCISDFSSAVFGKYERSVKYLEDNVCTDDIVITHHMPSYKCVNAKYAGSLLNCYFANELDYIISNNKPKLWIHGHTHSYQDCTVDGVRVLGNPLGYPGENNMFDDNLIIEV
jgi:predicted phosphodiesterase